MTVLCNTTMNYRDRITTKLTEAFRPVALDVIDESHMHAGHNLEAAAGETHFRVRITAPVFAGMSRLDRHRRINEVLAAELGERVHALAIEAQAPAA